MPLKRVCIYVPIQVWNEELALLAEGFAAKCFANDTIDDNLRSSTFNSIGRNFYIQSESATVNYSAIVDTWFKESLGYNYEENSCTGSSCRNYTQVSQWFKLARLPALSRVGFNPPSPPTTTHTHTHTHTLPNT